jgi:membrane associated rhomboid family serine protease
MALHNRAYWKDEGDTERGGSSWLFPRPSPVVLSIIIACAAVFLLTLVTGRDGSPLYDWLQLFLPDWPQLWRFVTYQFQHADPGHFLFNMLGLYFFGPPLERLWGGRRFLAFYLACGVFAGLCYLGLGVVYVLGPLVGASGCVLACLAGCAILFPSMRVFIFPIRGVAVFFAILYTLSILWGANLADAAHLGGMVAAAAWIGLTPAVSRMGERLRRGGRKGAWNRRMDAMRKEQQEIDGILKKISDQGLASLTRREKKRLADATRRQQQGQRDRL